MFANLLKPRPIISDHSAQWLLDCFQWALDNYDAKAFEQCQLILPTNQFFPGRVDSVHGMAEAIFKQVIAYAGLQSWPFVLVAPEQYVEAPIPLLDLDGSNRSTPPQPSQPGPELIIGYRPRQIKQPEAMAASFSHVVAQHLVYQSRQVPPGGRDYVAQATEVVAVFMGFGLLLTNSAYTFRSGCGSCYDPAANRQAALSETEVMFALAIFNELKGIESRHVFQRLKKHLRGPYKKAVTQLNNYHQQLTRLRQAVPISTQ